MYHLKSLTFQPGQTNWDRGSKKVIYTVNNNRAYMHNYCSFTRPWCIFAHFYKDCVDIFWIKICKIGTFSILEDYRWSDVVAKESKTCQDLENINVLYFIDWSITPFFPLFVRNVKIQVNYFGMFSFYIIIFCWELSILSFFWWTTIYIIICTPSCVYFMFELGNIWLACWFQRY